MPETPRVIIGREMQRRMNKAPSTTKTYFPSKKTVGRPVCVAGCLKERKLSFDNF